MRSARVSNRCAATAWKISRWITSPGSSTMTTRDNIILCGFMGTGKTTIGQRVSARLDWQFIDTDQVIEARQGRLIREIFAQDGEPAFRRLESELCLELSSWRHMVIATGGGIVLNPDN